MRPRRPRIIVCSAKTAAADQDRARDLGADRYVTKPYAPDHLVEQIREVLAIPEPRVRV
jgi:DNA-binding response OmpR family regulator